jgi:hypothetical protein
MNFLKPVWAGHLVAYGTSTCMTLRGDAASGR